MHSEVSDVGRLAALECVIPPRVQFGVDGALAYAIAQATRCETAHSEGGWGLNSTVDAGQLIIPVFI